ncbi:hypothetical protein ACNJYD_12720 [Bradyrhizobium sp. DASA03005]|uniref:hypothetical protein n=1 Tax=Bradyrhizobium TaxID=374 RepID=UPI00155EEFDA|nr:MULTISPECIES: hypothetical protein [Bradyrhizobium]MDD1518446.1 hypothetical protein [Bradyrhizobium sp. WBAH30]MDD1542244.1 hypothetical protein [Bradyrhizobium sp. WBAH41]MDD1556396.1 hypothetical protein [Bradyrhizobium sp. WBAH23]MDD1561763.1 hypothetical protein [Bradyrhizobium sp. WBAH33]MDD1589215.1 hypothetical protein [Bradyrhizobium sp. WBAH42]
MILSTHAIVGGAIASLFQLHPAAAAIAGFASHFAIDAIPHWDYPLRSISLGKGANNRRLSFSRATLRDFAIIGIDACAGLGLALWMFAAEGSIWIIAIGASTAMLPDALQFVHTLYPRGLLHILQRFHWWIHSKRALTGLFGVGSQLAFAGTVAVLARSIH